MNVRLPIALGLGEAQKIAGSLGVPGKMPGFAYGLDAFRCITGSVYAKVPGTICSKCYARKNFYQYWRPAIIARERRHAGLEHPLWVDAMVTLIAARCEPPNDYFRWHDSGDLMSVDHLHRIARVCRRTPQVKHWLPTREQYFVSEFLKTDSIPSNLCIRVSALHFDRPPDVLASLSELPTSTANTEDGFPVPVSNRRRDSIECRAYTRDNKCGACRACWEPRVRNVSYPEH